ncbi:hypothetical protein RGU12_07555 [Fredinandcohnia sp. QZ13]|nr:hypothetical protein [Fredinandcohnia sp. QZ13]MDR4887414.1 hypothetical protein [Fredinandcohnia sp. QZ13]
MILVVLTCPVSKKATASFSAIAPVTLSAILHNPFLLINELNP